MLKLKIFYVAVAIDTNSFSPVRFKEHSESTLPQLNSENKSIFIMGDFNINLLNCESHPESNDFLLMLNSFFFYLISYNQHVLLKNQQPSLIIYLQIQNYAMNAISGNLV